MKGPSLPEEKGGREDGGIVWPLVWLSDVLPDTAYIPKRQSEEEEKEAPGG